MKTAAALLAVMIAAGAARADPWVAAESANAGGDCGTAAPLYEQVLAAKPQAARQIAATHALALCRATPETGWQARELMAGLLPVVLAHYGPRSAGLARHHAIWAEAEVRARALEVAWRRSEAAVTALRAAGQLDPFEHAAELFRLAAIQHARGASGTFVIFLTAELERLKTQDWASPGDDELFAELMGETPVAGDHDGLGRWAAAGLRELDPRPLYLALVGGAPSQ